MHKPRPYQVETISRVKTAIERGQRRGVVHYATGLGKTVTAFELYRALIDPTEQRALFIAPSRSLILQTAYNAENQIPELKRYYQIGKRLRKGIGVVMGSINTPDARFVVASAQTLIDRNTEGGVIERADLSFNPMDKSVEKSPKSKLPVLVSARVDEILSYGLPELVLIDECHHAVSDGSLTILSRIARIREVLQLKPMTIIGFTATPIRADKRGLNNLFDVIYDSRDFMWGQRNNYLAPFAPPIRVKLQSLSSRDIEVNEATNWAEQVVETYQELAKDRYAMAFTGGLAGLSAVEASKTLARKFIEMGIPAMHTDGATCIGPNGETVSTKEREGLYNDYREGRIRVCSAFNVGLEGLDLPRADCLLWLRATPNEVLRTQAVGRVLRLHPDKKDALIIDFTDEDITLDPIGSLLGYRVDAKGNYEADPEAEPEDDSVEVGNLPYVTKDNSDLATKRVYLAAKIVTKQDHNWYVTPNEQLVLTARKEDTLLILPPNRIMLSNLRTIEKAVVDCLSGEGNPFTQVNNPELYKWYAEFDALDESDKMSISALLEYCLSLFGSYTLWHINTLKAPQLKQRGFVANNEDLSALLSESVDYIVNNIPEYGAMVDIHRTRALSGQQRSILEELRYTGKTEGLTQAEAWRLIGWLRVEAFVQTLVMTLETVAGGLLEHPKKR